jgi:hypothetical protein
MSHYGVVNFTVPTNRIDGITTYFGLSSRKGSKIETLIAGCQTWSQFLDVRKLRGTSLYLSIRHNASVDTGMDILNSRWDEFIRAIDASIWDRYPHLKPNESTPSEAMALRLADRVVEVAVMAAMPFFRLGNNYAERGLYLLEIPNVEILGIDDTEKPDPTNEVFEPLFGAFDDLPACISVVNFKGLVPA